MENSIKYIAVSFILILVFESCSEINNDPELSIRHAPVESFIVLSDSIPNVSFLVKAWWSNTCGEYHSADILNDGSIYNIKINGWVSRTGVVCGDAFTLFEGRTNVIISKAGNYTFKFWTSDSTSIDTTFFVSGN